VLDCLKGKGETVHCFPVEVSFVGYASAVGQFGEVDLVDQLFEPSEVVAEVGCFGGEGCKKESAWGEMRFDFDALVNSD
jgi:hypothetical protein